MLSLTALRQSIWLCVDRKIEELYQNALQREKRREKQRAWAAQSPSTKGAERALNAYLFLFAALVMFSIYWSLAAESKPPTVSRWFV